MEIEEKIKEALAREIGFRKEGIVLETDSKFGDYAFPCFELAKMQRRNPNDLAKETVSKLAGKLKFLRKIEAINGFVNFFVDKKVFSDEVLNEVLEKKDNFGKRKENKKIMVEYETPNTNKPLHIGHLRNAAIGMSVSNILEFNGNKVIRADLFNDRGIHICKAMLAYEKLTTQKKPKKGQKPDNFVGSLYVLFNQKAKEEPELEKDIRYMLLKWEKGDKKTIELWKKINDWAISGIKETDKKFGSEFDVYFYESKFYKKAQKIIKNGLQKKVFVNKAEGVVAELEPEFPNKVVQRQDGTSVYISNDLFLTVHKFSEFKIDKSIWVVGSEQNLYFKQLFKILENLGYKFIDKCLHLSYGMILLESGKMKSREGNVVDADDFIADIENLAEQELKKRYKLDKSEMKKRKEAIALSAIKYSLLKINPIKDLLFNPDEAVSFEGDSGPYIQYSYARASSILAKANNIKGKSKEKKNKASDYDINEKEFEVIKRISEFPKIAENAGKQLRPDLIANYAFKLSQAFNDFYESCPVINAEGNEREFRIKIVRAFVYVLGNCLKMMGIEALEKM